MILITCDPGKNGGWAMARKNIAGIWVDPQTWVMADTAIGIARDIKNKIQLYDNEEVRAVIERVHSFPGQGVVSSFSFGTNYGMVQGVLGALGISTDFITPKKWQNKLGMLPPDKAERKREIKRRVICYYPSLTSKVTLKTADALAMLHALTRD